MGHVSGFAYLGNEAEIRKSRQAKYNQLRGYVVKLTSIDHLGTRSVYQGEIPEGLDLSDLDIALICDGGNACFGADVSRHGNTFTCTIFTD